MTLVVIGVDPHKGSHTAVAVDRDENELDELRVRSSKKQCDVLLDWARPVPAAAVGDRVGVGARVSARAAVRGGGRGRGRCAADVVGAGAGAGLDQGVEERSRTTPGRRRSWRCGTGICDTVAADDHAAILRMLANRHHALTRLRTQAVCRLHAQLANLTPGGLAGTLSAKRARELLETDPSRQRSHRRTQSTRRSSCSTT